MESHRPFAPDLVASSTTLSRGRAAATAPLVLLLVVLVATPGARAAVPPTLVNYQGVLRDQNDKPLSGTYDMLFRFMDADTAGNEILIEQHAAVTANAVTVSGGLFSVALGSGTITDGSGAGTYTTLDAVFRDYGSVWLEIRVGAETLSPRTRIQSAPYALNASSAVNATQLNGQPADNFIDTSSTEQLKTGRFQVDGDSGSGYALVGRDFNSFGTGVLGYGDGWGVQGNSNHNGGSFNGNDYGVWASASNYAGGLFQGSGGAYGIKATSSSEAGRFESTNSYAPSADLASGNVGAAGTCVNYGGIGVSGNGERYGVDGHASGAFAGGAIGGNFTAGGALSIGVDATGTTGGRFFSPGAPGGEVDVASSAGGVVASGFTNYGGNFQTSGSTSTGVYASGGDSGVNGVGGNYGGKFQGSASTGYGVYGYGSDGIVGYGTSYGVRATGGSAGAFIDNVAGTSATLATGTMGISASGTTSGGYFSDGSPWFSYTYVPYQGDGVYAYGSSAGGEFHNFATSSWAFVGWSTYKIAGTGSVAFVQNHPDDSSKVIVYNAPEGDEVAVYTRGAGRLANGEARVALGATFAMVTNPDIGLTATVTPRGEPIPLAVSEVSPGELVVRGPAGSDAAFDYMVWGLRIGFEEQSIVQPKKDDAKIPSMQQHEKFFADEPALRSYTALSRYKGVEEAVHGKKVTDLSRADRLRDAIGVFTPQDASAAAANAPGRAAGTPSARPVPTWSGGNGAGLAGNGPSTPSPPTWGMEGGSGAGGRETGGTTPPPAAGSADPAAARLPADGLDLFAADGNVELGDVVSLGTDAPGSVVRSSGPADALVIGCAQLREAASPQVAVATSHIALCRVDAAFGAIAVGDRLTASPAAGTAMKVDPAAGAAILGRAIEPLDSGTGLVRVLLGAR
jgi:hypothetical protein